MIVIYQRPHRLGFLLRSISLLNTHPTVEQRIRHLEAFAHSDEFAHILRETEQVPAAKAAPHDGVSSVVTSAATGVVVDVHTASWREKALSIASDTAYNAVVISSVASIAIHVVAKVWKTDGK